jgi:hypothetical protein
MAQQTNRLDRTRETTKDRESRREERQPAQDFVNYLREYARENPEMTALWCLGVGFILGWKLKPW